MAAYFTVVNVIAFIMYGVDKRRAIRGNWRIPEKTLIGVAGIGGAFGALAGMYFFRHKTQKPMFKTLVPLFCVAYIIVFYKFIK